MYAEFHSSAADRAIAAITACLTPDVASRLATAQVDQATAARIEELAARNTDGELSDAERSEYETYVSVVDVIALLQTKARRLASGMDAA